MTHVTIVSVTVFLHRHQAHRALDLHPIASHFFRFWLWLTTGQVTKEWASIHRKHHAKCEQAEDPHSPHVYGIRKVLFDGAELYRDRIEESGDPGPLWPWHARRLDRAQPLHPLFLAGRWPDDDRSIWRCSALAGLAVWAVQMAWIPITAAGIINGAAHYWGYRNFEAPDASTNISPWGILIGGEELHNNHHTYPTSAKLSVKPYEFDIGWMYISLMRSVGLASVKKTPPKLAFGDIRPVADEKTLEAVIANRYEVMAGYARQHARRVSPGSGGAQGAQGAMPAWSWRRAAGCTVTPTRCRRRRCPSWPRRVPRTPVLDKMVVMREELRQIWLNTSQSREQLAADLQAWCRRAEDSGIAALREFSMQLRAARLQAT